MAVVGDITFDKMYKDTALMKSDVLSASALLIYLCMLLNVTQTRATIAITLNT